MSTQQLMIDRSGAKLRSTILKVSINAELDAPSLKPLTHLIPTRRSLVSPLPLVPVIAVIRDHVWSRSFFVVPRDPIPLALPTFQCPWRSQQQGSVDRPRTTSHPVGEDPGIVTATPSRNHRAPGLSTGSTRPLDRQLGACTAHTTASNHSQLLRSGSPSPLLHLLPVWFAPLGAETLGRNELGASAASRIARSPLYGRLFLSGSVLSPPPSCGVHCHCCCYSCSVLLQICYAPGQSQNHTC